ncbi:adenylate kinase [Plasmodium cynomolgi strain B]|uniref:Adenylate kinase n=1 Tax=Plasmodium cynomolgi (strain B) TaxID=1120755 RepID=K6UCP9_PLACD|nr:adenylate kinase [Plasmodium cynomolgi strain B]GAB65231.1 adenylate kinase [Plasmodium cynomolgi strain B]
MRSANSRQATQMEKQKGPQIFILNGAAGSGKDTQCRLIVEKYNFAVITISTLLKEYVLESEEREGEGGGGGGTSPSASLSPSLSPCPSPSLSPSPDEESINRVERKKEDVKRIKKCMKDGSLVPDDIVIKVFMDRLKKYTNGEEPCVGIVVNGFPRTYEQALLFAKNGIKVTSFINIQVKKDNLMSRISNRMVDPVTNINYNAKGVELLLKNKNGIHLTENEELLLSSQGDAFKNTSDEVIARLTKRADDDKATFLKRFHLYEENEEKILSLFPTVYRSVDGNGSIEETFAQICAILDGANRYTPLSSEAG